MAVETDGRHFIYLARDNAVFEMEPEIHSLVELYENDSQRLTSDLEDSRRQAGSDRWSVFESLLAGRIVLREASEENMSGESMSEKGVSEAQGRKDIPMRTLVLHLTDACNLDCAYCYHEDAGSEDTSVSSMSQEVAMRATDLLVENSGNAKEIVLVFFGGEPLLRFPLIRETTAYARKRAADADKKVKLAITTNATLLTPEIIGFLHGNEIGVTVSMDGVGELHDRHRRFRDGSKTYKTVERNVLALLNARGSRPVVARVTVADSAEHVPETLDQLLALGFSEAGFAPVTTADPRFQLDKDGMDLLLEKFRLLSERFLETAMAGDLLGFTNLIDLLTTLHEGEVKSHPCGAGLGLFSVDPKGRLYPCQRFTGRKRWRMGDVASGPDYEKVAPFRKASALNAKTPCKSCRARAICAGGCYHEALVRMGDASIPNLHYCGWIKEWLAVGLHVYTKLHLARPDYLDKLSMTRGHAPFQSHTL